MFANFGVLVVVLLVDLCLRCLRLLFIVTCYFGSVLDGVVVVSGCFRYVVFEVCGLSLRCEY